jgi:anti-sigma factor RsiW
MPDCRHIASLLNKYVDGELRPEERVSVEEHVKGCHSCHRELEELTALRSRLQEAVEAGIADAPLSRIWEGMAERLETPTVMEQMWWEFKSLFSFFRPRTALAWGAAIVVTSPPTPRVVVESVESEHPVMVFQGEDEVMIVWLFMEEKGEEVTR